MKDFSLLRIHSLHFHVENSDLKEDFEDCHCPSLPVVSHASFVVSCRTSLAAALKRVDRPRRALQGSLALFTQRTR